MARSAPIPAPIPDGLPLLSRGKHRNPKKGACFMELASFLAGERWSDHPACTHPLLAEVARNTNDRTSDAGRPLLAPLIPAVVGLTTDDPRADARIALHCALTGLSVASFERQRALAVAVLACRRQLVAVGEAATEPLLLQARHGLEAVPDAAAWAAAFAGRTGATRRETSPRRFRSYSAPSIIRIAARGIAEAATPSQDAVLRRMLEGAIDQCRALQSIPVQHPIDDSRWRQALALTR